MQGIRESEREKIKILSRLFDDCYKKNARFIHLEQDLNLGDELLYTIEILSKSNHFYQLSKKRYIKTQWVIDAMRSSIANKSYISVEKVENLLKKVAKTNSINRANMTKMFFRDSNFLSTEKINQIEILAKEEIGMLQNTVSLEASQSNLVSNVEYDSLYSNRTVEDLISDVLDQLAFMKIHTQEELFRLMVGKMEFSDIRQLCEMCRLYFPSLSIDAALKIGEFQKQGLNKIIPKNKKSVHRDIPENHSERLSFLKSKIKERHWECYYAYTIDGNETLESLGDRYDVTRERIRQIIKKTKMKIKSQKKIFQDTKDYFDEVFRYTALFELKHLIDPKLELFANDMNKLKEQLCILNVMFDKNYQIVESNYVTYLDLDTASYKLINILFHRADRSYIVMHKKEFANRLKAIELNLQNNAIGVILRSMENRVNILNYEEYNLLYLKKGRLTNVDVCKYVMYHLQEPSHYSKICREFNRVSGNGNKLTEKNILATLDRSEEQGIIRTFTGTYGLIELGAKKHVPVKDIIIDFLEEEGQPLHYDSILEKVQQLSGAKEKSVFTYLNTMDEIISNDEEYYALASWKDRLDDSYANESKFSRKLLEHGYNSRGYYYIKYLITESLFNNHTLYLPKNKPFELDRDVKVVNIDGEEYYITYYGGFPSYLYRLDDVLRLQGISIGSSIYVELLSESTIAVISEEDYEAYLNGTLNSNSKFSREQSPIENLLNLFFDE